MIDVNSFLLMILYFLGAILLVVLIVLGIKLIGTVTKIDNILDELEIKLSKVDKLFGAVDIIADGMAMFSDRVVDAICSSLKKIMSKKKGKEEDIDE